VSLASAFIIGGVAMSAFWLGAFFAVMVLDLAPYHDRRHYRVTSAANSAIFGAFAAALWLLP
jgi:hypothetical protein